MAKRKRSNSTSDKLTSVDATHILDLNDDCLEHVFSFLPTYDLCAVKKTCQKFANSAEDVFKARYRHRPLNVAPEIGDLADRGSFDRAFMITTTFGPLITKLSIHNVVAERDDWIFTEIFYICTKLKDLKLSECALHRFPWMGEDPPIRLESLQISNCFGDEHLIMLQLSKLMCLSLTIEYDASLLKLDRLQHDYPCLREITIRGWDWYENVELNRSLPNFIRAHPKLEKINFNFYHVKFNILPAVAAHSRELKSLSLQLNDEEEEESVEKLAELRRLNHLHELQISCAAFNDNIAPSIEALAEKNLLRTLSISDTQLDPVLRRAICKLTNLETLKLVKMSGDNASGESLGILAENLGKLKHLHVIQCNGILFEHMVPFIERSKTLASLTLYERYRKPGDELFKQLLAAKNSSGATTVLEIFLCGFDRKILSEQQRKQMNEAGYGRIQLMKFDENTKYVYVCKSLDDEIFYWWFILIVAMCSLHFFCWISSSSIYVE